jgi:hypothetical protein
MADHMTIAMSAWMPLNRGHRWAATAEMAAAMYLPFIVLFLPLWLALLTADRTRRRRPRADARRHGRGDAPATSRIRRPHRPPQLKDPDTTWPSGESSRQGTRAAAEYRAAAEHTRVAGNP